MRKALGMFVLISLILSVCQTSNQENESQTISSCWFREDIKTSTAPVISNNKAYVGNGDSTICCLDAKTGENIWETGFQGKTISNIAASGGRAFLVVSDEEIRPFIEIVATGKIVCLDDKDGSIVWEYGNNEKILSRLYPRGSHLLFGTQNSLHCLEVESGKAVWSKKSSLFQMGSLVEFAFASGRLYCSQTNKLVCIDEQTGSGVWEYATEEQPFYPATTDSKVYLCSLPSTAGMNHVDRKTFVSQFFCLDDRKQEAEWSCMVSVSASSATVLSGNKAFFTGFDGANACVDLISRKQLWIQDNGCLNLKHSPPIVSQDKLYMVQYPQVIEADPQTGKLIKTISMGNFAAIDGKNCYAVSDQELSCNSVENPLSWETLKGLAHQKPFNGKGSKGYNVIPGLDNKGVWVLKDRQKVWETPKDWSLWQTDSLSQEHPYFWHDDNTVVVIKVENEKHVFYGFQLSSGKQLWMFDQGDYELFSSAGTKLTFRDGFAKTRILDISKGSWKNEIYLSSNSVILYESSISNYIEEKQAIGRMYDIVQIQPMVYLINGFVGDVLREKCNNNYYLVNLKGKACTVYYQMDFARTRLSNSCLRNGSQYAFESIEYINGTLQPKVIYIADTKTGTTKKSSESVVKNWESLEWSSYDEMSYDILDEAYKRMIDTDEQTISKITGLVIDKSESHYNQTHLRAYKSGEIVVATKEKTVADDDFSNTTIEAMVGYNSETSRKIWETTNLRIRNLVFLNHYIVAQGSDIIDGKTGRASSVLKNVTVIDIKDNYCFVLAVHQGKEKILLLDIDKLNKLFE